MNRFSRLPVNSLASCTRELSLVRYFPTETYKPKELRVRVLHWLLRYMVLEWDRVLEEKGANRIHDRVDCDVDYEDDAEEWIENVISIFG